ncbi:DUF1285 domain-containing protein [Marinobacterium sp. D7]|uniref:DUF1285 domain-containing protein n=1 Tax=Marinobacterium ramblicola TaxID=2849041 RepID=UPI001C2D8AB8|nr:DUF1285 domain-containing protein [Marinobacterium ramblicola]MBV1790582.1 DUF1285 domain-containing protein [Marinobacterium ramblicola]
MAGINLADLSHGLEQQGQGIPPLEQWNPEFCGDIDMRIARDGTWYHEGTPIGRKAMVKMFSRILWRENDDYFLKTPVEKVRIQVDDLPFQLIALEVIEGDAGQELHFTSSTDDHIVAGPEHPLQVIENSETGEPAPALRVRFGMDGRISRNLFYRLVELAQTEPCTDGSEELVVYSCGERYSLGRI